MDAHQTHELSTALAAQIVQCSQLLELLQREHAALDARNTSAITATAEEKIRAIAALDALWKKQAELLLGTDIAKAPLPDQCSRLRDQLKSLLQQCEAQNQQNGTIVAAGKHFAEQALAVLRGRASQSETLYDRAGKAHGTGASSAVIKA